MKLEKVAHEQDKRERFEKTTGRTLNPDEKTPDEPKSLSETLKNPAERDLFTQLVKNIDADPDKKTSIGALARLGAEEPLTPDDLALFEKTRYEFALRMQDAKRLDAMLTNDDFDSVMDADPGIRSLVGTLPPGRGVEVMRQSLPMLAMQDRKFLDDFSNAFNRVKAARANPAYKELHTRTNALVTRHGFTEKDFAGLIDPNDPTGADSLARARAKIKQNLKGWDGFKEWARRGKLSSEEAVKVCKAALDIKTSKETGDLEVISTGLGEVGSILLATISGNERIMKEITTEIVTGKKARIAADTGSFKSMDEVKTGAKNFKEADITGTMWTRYKNALESGDAEWGIKGDGIKWGARPDQDAKKTDFLGRMSKQEFERAGGFLASLLGAMIARLIGGIDKAKLT